MHAVMVAFESSTAVHLLKETSIISLTVHPSSKIDCNSNRYLYISVPVFHLFFNHSNRLVLVKSTIFFDICLINPIWLLKLLWAIFFQDNYSIFCQNVFLFAAMHSNLRRTHNVTISIEIPQMYQIESFSLLKMIVLQ